VYSVFDSVHYLSLDVRQTDCPLTRATRTHDATFTTPYWYFDSGSGRWELRVHATARNRHALGGALRALRDADSVDRFELHSKRATTAFVQTTFAETTAIGTIDRHDGYVIGPFRNVAGTEQWHLGFDTEAAADAALSDLDRREEFTVRDRHRLDPTESADSMPERIPHGTSDRLTEREREVLETALERGYYETPRTTTLDALGEILDVSDVAVSKTLRRVERKILTDAVDRTDDR
jgi:predicted DNA binding protein